MTYTDNGEVTWRETARTNTYEVTFPNHTVAISQRDGTDPIEPDYFIEVYNSEGMLMGEFSDNELRLNMPDSYKVMKNLYSLAKEGSTGLDQAIDEIISELSDRVPF